jgi:flagellar basal body-associated protein FliL
MPTPLDNGPDTSIKKGSRSSLMTALVVVVVLTIIICCVLGIVAVGYVMNSKAEKDALHKEEDNMTPISAPLSDY